MDPKAISMELSTEEAELIRAFRSAKTTVKAVESDSDYMPNWAVAPAEGIHGPHANCAEHASAFLFDLNKLHIPGEHQPWCGKVIAAAQVIMSKIDNSHHWEHIQRVTAIALRIYEAETQSNPSTIYDPVTLFISMVVHDVGDRKYLEPNGPTGEEKTKNLLRSCGTPESYISTIWTIANGVSYKAEMRNPSHVRHLISQHPELSIVQDADRVDSLGVVGIARCFAFGGHDEARKYASFDKAAQFIWERNVKSLHYFKTETGRQMAYARWPEMELFWKAYAKEVDVSNVLPSTERLEDMGEEGVAVAALVEGPVEMGVEDALGEVD